MEISESTVSSPTVKVTFLIQEAQYLGEKYLASKTPQEFCIVGYGSRIFLFKEGKLHKEIDQENKTFTDILTINGTYYLRKMQDGIISYLNEETDEVTELLRIGNNDSFSKVLRSSFKGKILLIINNWKQLYYLNFEDNSKTPIFLLAEESDIEQLTVYGENEDQFVIISGNKLKFFSLNQEENGKIKAKFKSEIPFEGFGSWTTSVCPNNEFLVMDNTGENKGIDIFRINRKEKSLFTSVKLEVTQEQNINTINFTRYFDKNTIGILCTTSNYPNDKGKLIFVLYDVKKKMVLKIQQEELDCGNFRRLERHGDCFIGACDKGKIALFNI